MKILLIGGTGNISSDCAEHLYQRGHEIMVLTRGTNPVPAEYRSIIADRKDPVAVRDALKGLDIEVVINFLGYLVPEIEIDFAAFNGRISQYIFISTTMVYAKPHCILPITEKNPVGNIYSDYADGEIPQRKVPGHNRQAVAYLFKTMDSEPDIKRRVFICGPA